LAGGRLILKMKDFVILEELKRASMGESAEIFVPLVSLRGLRMTARTFNEAAISEMVNY